MAQAASRAKGNPNEFKKTKRITFSGGVHDRKQDKRKDPKSQFKISPHE